MEKLNRLNDRFIKFLFANPRHKTLLIAFLNDVLADIPAGAERLPSIADIEYADRETTPTHERAFSRCPAPRSDTADQPDAATLSRRVSPVVWPTRCRALT